MQSSVLSDSKIQYLLRQYEDNDGLNNQIKYIIIKQLKQLKPDLKYIGKIKEFNSKKYFEKIIKDLKKSNNHMSEEKLIKTAFECVLYKIAEDRLALWYNGSINIDEI